MMRVLGVIVIVIGLLIFIGNFTGLAPTRMGLGIVLVLIGGLVVGLSDRFDAIPPGNEE